MVISLSYYFIVENVCCFIFVKICFEFWLNKINFGLFVKCKKKVEEVLK